MAVNRTKVLEAAQKFLSKGQYDKAIAEYQKLVSEDPRDVRTLLKIGDLHTRRNKPKDAIDVYEKVAELYARQGFFLKAVAVYKQILKLDATHLTATLRLAQMYEELALANDALTTYEQAADALLAQGQTDRALETMQRMIELDSQNIAARIKYAEALSKANRAREAAQAFAEGARLLREQGRIDDYIRVVERQLYHDPENVDIARELSSRYLERSDPKRALAKLQICFKADPRDIQTLEMLAEAFRQLNQVPKTISVLKEIARLHSEVNAEEPRRRTLLRILDLDPSDAEARQALSTLAAPKPARPTQAEPAAKAPEPAPAPQARKVASEPPDEVLEFEEEEELSLDDAEEGSDALLLVGEEPASDGFEPDVSDLLAEAEVYEGEGDYARAEEALRNALLLEEDNVEVHERLKDVYFASDRRVEAVRELLWLSEAASRSGSVERAHSYAQSAFDLAPSSEATRARLAALGLEPQTPQDEVVFVEDSFEDAEASVPDERFPPVSPKTERERPSVRAAAGFHEDVDPLDLPFSPDEFDGNIPEPRAREELPGDVAYLLEQPISAAEFDAEGASATDARDDVAALLDAPISPDEFDALPPPRFASGRAPQYELLDEPVDDFGLSDDRFDRSDLHDVGMDPIAGPAEPAALEILDERGYELLGGPEEPEPTGRPRETRELIATPYELEDAEAALAELRRADSAQMDDMAEATVPAEPIPELIRRSSQAELEPVASSGAAALPAPAPEPPPKAQPPAAALAPEIEEALDEAEFFASQGLLDEALEVVQEAILIFPNSEVLRERARAYQVAAEAKESERAEKEHEAQLDESFDIAEQLASQLSEVPPSSAHDEMVDVESVFAQFKKGVAAQISEDDTDTHFDLGIAYKEMGLVEDAIGEFELSAKSAKRACTAWTMIGMCHLEKGDPTTAVTYFERALSQPTTTAAEELALRYEIANAYELSGQLEKALSMFELVLGQDRSFRGVAGRVDQLTRRGISARASGVHG